MRDVEATMPAIASLEDLKASQKEGLSIYSMLFALCVGLICERMRVDKICGREREEKEFN
jgi:hypothetical protein